MVESMAFLRARAKAWAEGSTLQVFICAPVIDVFSSENLEYLLTSICTRKKYDQNQVRLRLERLETALHGDHPGRF